MMNLIKKYWFNLAVLLILVSLLLFFIPHEEERYFPEEFSHLKKQAATKAAWTAGLLAGELKVAKPRSQSRNSPSQ